MFNPRIRHLSRVGLACKECVPNCVEESINQHGLQKAERPLDFSRRFIHHSLYHFRLSFRIEKFKVTTPPPTFLCEIASFLLSSPDPSAFAACHMFRPCVEEIKILAQLVPRHMRAGCEHKNVNISVDPPCEAVTCVQSLGRKARRRWGRRPNVPFQFPTSHYFLRFEL